MYSLNIDGEVRDYKFTRYKDKRMDFVWSFRLGEEFIGQIFRHDKHNWCAVTWNNVNNDELWGPRRVDGFGTRLDAANYMLRIRNLIKE